METFERVFAAWLWLSWHGAAASGVMLSWKHKQQGEGLAQPGQLLGFPGRARLQGQKQRGLGAPTVRGVRQASKLALVAPQVWGARSPRAKGRIHVEEADARHRARLRWHLPFIGCGGEQRAGEAGPTPLPGERTARVFSERGRWWGWVGAGMSGTQRAAPGGDGGARPSTAACPDGRDVV